MDNEGLQLKDEVYLGLSRGFTRVFTRVVKARMDHAGRVICRVR